MKDKHTINLILISSRWFNSFLPKIVLDEVILSSKLFIFLVRSSKFTHFVAPSKNHCKASPCVFNFSFFLSSFYYRSSSWRLYMMVHQGFLSFSFWFFKISLGAKIRQAILKIKHGAKHMSCFEELKYSSSCIPKCNSPTLSFEMVLYHSWQFSFMFHDSHVVKNEVF